MKKFEHDLDVLKRRLVEMGEIVASMIDLATRGLAEQNEEVSSSVVALESKINQMQLDIDKDAIRLLTVYSPVAADLRFVLMVSKINSELERIADQAVNMCEYLQLLVSGSNSEPLPECPRMAKLVLEMLNDALQAFFHMNRSTAEAVIAKDDLVDALNNEVLRRCLEQKQEDISHNVAEILLARALERIADQATNICEEVVYIVSGEDIRHTGG